MAADLKNVKYSKNRGDTFPAAESIVVDSAVSIVLQCTSANAVQFNFANLGTSGVIEPNEVKTIVSNGDPVTDTIELTFTGASEIETSWAVGAGSVPAGGSATAANQLIIISYLNGTTTSVFSGNNETISLVEDTVAGTRNTDIALSMSIRFYGSGGALNGVTVPDGYEANFSGTMRNEIASIPYTVPTSPDFNGFQKVTIAYSKK
jgi:hypothetical protein